MSPFPERYNTKNIVEGVKKPYKIKKELYRLLRASKRSVSRRHICREYGDPVNVMNKDWDTLIILDACRYDFFREHNTIDGVEGSIVSISSTSSEFMEKTFVGKTFHDTVYVSANGYSHHLDTGTFHEFISTYPDSNQAQDYGENHYFSPQLVRNTAIEAFERNPNKHLIIHFMQPHGPYFGPKAQNLRERVMDEHDVRFTGLHPNEDSNEDDKIVYLMNAAERGYISSDELKEVYIENLEIVLGHVEDVLGVVDGKTVVTSDHGELFGEVSGLYSRFLASTYEHPGYSWVPELRLVPWFTAESGERREITSESPGRTDVVDETVVDSQLKALGYK